MTRVFRPLIHLCCGCAAIVLPTLAVAQTAELNRAADAAPLVGPAALDRLQMPRAPMEMRERADEVLGADWRSATQQYQGREVDPQIDADLTRARADDAVVPVPLPTSALGGVFLLGGLATQRMIRARATR